MGTLGGRGDRTIDDQSSPQTAAIQAATAMSPLDIHTQLGYDQPVVTPAQVIQLR
jgi:hypothetical protein